MSIGMIRFLMSIPNPSEEIIEAIHGAVYFFDYIRIDGYRLNHSTDLDPQLGRNLVLEEGARPLWPRFMDLETFEPLFFDRTGPVAATVTPHQNVNIGDFEARNGEWLGYRSGFISANATSAGTDASAVRAGTLRNLYRDENGELTTDRSGTFDLVASFHNLSFERRSGFNYINHFAEDLPKEYQEWLDRNGLEPEVEVSVVEVIPTAVVNQRPGNTNELVITVTEHLSDGTTRTMTESFEIRNNASGTYEVGDYRVFVNTQGNTQIREIYIVE